jgi:hypothetical protein
VPEDCPARPSFKPQPPCAAPSAAGNGALAGLVAITGGCAFVNTWAALVIGFVAGLVYYGLSKLMLHKLRVRGCTASGTSLFSSVGHLWAMWPSQQHGFIPAARLHPSSTASVTMPATTCRAPRGMTHAPPAARLLKLPSCSLAMPLPSAGTNQPFWLSLLALPQLVTNPSRVSLTCFSWSPLCLPFALPQLVTPLLARCPASAG